ncbi:hypothetical protein [uncultured Photobacterium sp.]|uniref:hypothetical protein n=1 Tax=uncultured Photobacterium sp. TaxID=173973 RepID=UPI0026160D73|nr:hypothetical protein [uncultured Photobacterium sp.]
MKLLVKFLVISLLLPAYSYASENSNKQTVMDKFDQLNVQTDRCMNVGRRTVEQVNDNWFQSLEIQQKRLVLVELRKKALERCVKDIEAEYTYAVFKYTADTKDKTYLDAWLALNEDKTSNAYREALNKLPSTEMKRLSESVTFYYPFDSFRTSKHLGLEE